MIRGFAGCVRRTYQRSGDSDWRNQGQGVMWVGACGESKNVRRMFGEYETERRTTMSDLDQLLTVAPDSPLGKARTNAAAAECELAHLDQQVRTLRNTRESLNKAFRQAHYATNDATAYTYAQQIEALDRDIETHERMVRPLRERVHALTTRLAQLEKQFEQGYAAVEALRDLISSAEK